MAVRAKYPSWFSGELVEGCKKVGNELHFPNCSTKNEAINLFGKCAKPSMSVTLGTKAVDDIELSRLKSLYPNVPFDSGVVFPGTGANLKRDLGNERFTEPILQLYAKQIRESSRTVMWQHDPCTHGLGMLFHAEMMGEDFKCWILIDNESTIPGQETRNLVKAVRNGYVKNLSLGYIAFGEYVEEKDSNGGTVYTRVLMIDPSRPYTMDATVTEISLVHFPMQSRTELGKAVDLEFINDLNMKHDLQIKVGEKSYTVPITVDGDKITADTTAIDAGIKAEIDAQTAKLAEAQKAVTALRSPLEADVINAKIGLDADTVKVLAAEKLIETAKAVTTGTKPVEQGKPKIDEAQKSIKDQVEKLNY